ncbi:MAG: hypothetical protein QXM12_00355 [Nitrososphaerota archaeon]
MVKRDYPEKELSILLSGFEEALGKCRMAASNFSSRVLSISGDDVSNRSDVVKGVEEALDALFDVYEQLSRLEDVAESTVGFTMNEDEDKKIWNFIKTVRSVREKVEMLQKNLKNYVKTVESPDLAPLAKKELEKEVRTFNDTVKMLDTRGNEFLVILRSMYERARMGRLP